MKWGKWGKRRKINSSVQTPGEKRESSKTPILIDQLHVIVQLLHNWLIDFVQSRINFHSRPLFTCRFNGQNGTSATEEWKMQRKAQLVNYYTIQYIHVSLCPSTVNGYRSSSKRNTFDALEVRLEKLVPPRLGNCIICGEHVASSCKTRLKSHVPSKSSNFCFCQWKSLHGNETMTKTND